MRTTCDSLIGAHLAGLVELLASWLRYFSCARRLLAQRMITIVAYFRALAVNFIFAGRNSGQEGTKRELGLIVRCSEQMASEQPFRTNVDSQRPSGFRGIPCGAAAIASVYPDGHAKQA